MMAATVLVTGASSGFGEATSRLFARSGWNVVATMRRPEMAPASLKLDNVLVTRLDVQDAASIGEAVRAGTKKFGGLDAVINNAGFGLYGVFEGTSREKILEQFQVNVFGAMDVIRAVLPHFRANRAGTIVNVSSGAGVFALPMISLYSASKFALEGFSEALSYELAGLGIAVKIVEPGGVTGTGFGQRSGDEAKAAATPSDYEPFVAATERVFTGLRSDAAATAEDVAKVIFEAVTDGSTQLRYVATDDIRPLVAARRETSEAEYIAFMRERFAPESVARERAA